MQWSVMDEIDRIVLRADGQRGMRSALIACLYTGRHLPDYCAAMPRLPEPPVGMVFNEGFPSLLGRTLADNPAVHDGAIMIGRTAAAMVYHIVGWSYRLYPPEGQCAAEPNRGSAFNSCLAMSGVETIDRVYLMSSGGLFRFEKGAAEKVCF
jgi:hypothetical protein